MTGAYLHSKAYHLAVALPASKRHDLNGNPVQSISDGDRADARKRAEWDPSVEARRDRRVEPEATPVEETILITKADQIRAGLLRRRT